MDQSYARGKLMLASFLTLVASGVGFATRTAASPAWEREFGISGAQFGAILGAGFLGFGLMIFFGGILVEKFGYKSLLGLAFLLHLGSAGMLFAANSMFAGWNEADPTTATEKVFNLLFWSAFAFSICQGLYEAVINPLIAQLYPDNQTHYLNILHAGWPAGMIIGGLFAAGFMGNTPFITEIPWAVAMSFFVVFVVAYGVLAFPEKFPETVGESSSDFGVLFSCFASAPFILLLVLHGLIGYMELGVDSWMTKLMENLIPNAVLVLVYTSALMFVLRFFAGPIVHKINPIGLLFGSSIIACGGLIWLSQDIDSLVMIFVAATFYSLGKAFLWPTMLGVAGERYPQSGSIAMGALGAVGMITIGQVGGPIIGTQQGYHMSQKLEEASADTFARYTDAEETKAWGYAYRAVDGAKLGMANKVAEMTDEAEISKIFADNEVLSDEDKAALLEHREEDVEIVQKANLAGSRLALKDTAMIPAAMAIGFLILVIYFKSIGGYRVISLAEALGQAEAPSGSGTPADAPPEGQSAES